MSPPHSGATRRGWAACQKMCWQSESTTSWPWARCVPLRKKRPVVSWVALGRALPVSRWDPFSLLSTGDAHTRAGSRSEPHWTSWGESDDRPQAQWTGEPFTEGEAKRAGTVPPEEVKSQEGLTNVYKQPTEDNKENGVRLFPVIHSEWRGGTKHKSN